MPWLVCARVVLCWEEGQSHMSLLSPGLDLPTLPSHPPPGRPIWCVFDFVDLIVLEAAFKQTKINAKRLQRNGVHLVQ